jgi:hypothetical protein
VDPRNELAEGVHGVGKAVDRVHQEDRNLKTLVLPSRNNRV